MLLLSSFLLLVHSLATSAAIECYICSSLNNEACVKPDRGVIPMKTCNSVQLLNTTNEARNIEPSFHQLFHVDSAQEPHMPLNCLKQITRVGDREVVLRGCQLATVDQLDICVKMKKFPKDTVYTKYCSLCNSNGCNGATPTKQFSVCGGGVFIGVLLLMQRKYYYYFDDMI